MSLHYRQHGPKLPDSAGADKSEAVPTTLFARITFCARMAEGLADGFQALLDIVVQTS